MAERRPPVWESAVRGGGQGLSAGFLDELSAAVSAAFPYPTPLDTETDQETRRAMRPAGRLPDDFGSRYDLARAYYRLRNARARQANPKAFTAGEIAGGVVSPGPKGLGGAVAMGALGGVGQSEADLTRGDVGGGLRDAGIGGALGAGAYGLVRGGERGLRALRERGAGALRRLLGGGPDVAPAPQVASAPPPSQVPALERGEFDTYYHGTTEDLADDGLSDFPIYLAENADEAVGYLRDQPGFLYEVLVPKAMKRADRDAVRASGRQGRYRDQPLEDDQLSALRDWQVLEEYGGQDRLMEEGFSGARFRDTGPEERYTHDTLVAWEPVTSGVRLAEVTPVDADGGLGAARSLLERLLQQEAVPAAPSLAPVVTPAAARWPGVPWAAERLARSAGRAATPGEEDRRAETEARRRLGW